MNTQPESRDAFTDLPGSVYRDCLRDPQRSVMHVDGHELCALEVADASERIRVALATAGVARGEHVACCVRRGPAALAAVLGILRAGAVMLPLDTEHPPARLSGMLQRCACRFAVIDPEFELLFREHLQLPATALFYLRQLELTVPRGLSIASLPEPLPLCAEDPAYTIFTSGSTGQPKGVTIPHGALAASVREGTMAIRMQAGDRCAQLASLTFDAAIWEHLTPMHAGATLVPVSPDVVADPAAFMACIAHEKISWTYLPPALFAAWVAHVESVGAQTVGVQLQSLRAILFAGEAVSLSLLRKWQGWFGDRILLMNFYGPTEATVLVCGHVVDGFIPADMTALPIGKEFGGNRILIFDEAMQLCAHGEVGSLYIGGDQLALGYVGEPELTANAFVADPIDPTERLYDSRDLGYRTAAGEIVFVGRRDNQIKIRGKRVELEEIQTWLARADGVLEAAVLVHEVQAHKQLLAFVAGVNLQPEVLRSWLAAQLPDYMLPHRIHLLPALPLGANDKVDRAALLAWVDTDRMQAEDRTPAVATDPIAAIWQQVLGQQVVDPDMDFHAAGGDSLLMVRALMLARGQGLAVPQLPTLLAHNTLRGWRRLLVPESQIFTPSVGVEQFPLTPMQREMFAWLDRYEQKPEQGSRALYHIQFVFSAQELDAQLLELAFRAVIRRHPTLRTVFKTERGERHNQVLPAKIAEDFHLHEVELDPADRNALEAWKMRDHAQAFQEDLFPLFRASRLRQGSDHYLNITFFHPLLDGWSFSHLVLQACQAYRALRAGSRLLLPQPRSDFSSYQDWCRHSSENTEVVAAERAYWREVLREPLPLVQLPLDGDGGAIERFAFWTPLPPELSARLKVVAARLSVTLHVVLFAAYFMLYSRITGQKELLIGNTVAGRPPQIADIDQILGCFISIVPVRLQDASLSFTQIIVALHQQLLLAGQQQHLPNETHVDALLTQAKARDLDWRVIFAFDNFPEQFVIDEVQWPPLAWNPIEPFTVALSMIDLHGCLYCYWNYRQDKISAASARNIDVMYEQLLHEIADCHA